MFALVMLLGAMGIAQAQSYTLTLGVNDPNRGDAQRDKAPGEYYNAGDYATITAIPKQGFIFGRWVKQGTNEVFSTEAVYKFEMTENLSLVAWFYEQPTQYTVSLTPSSTEGGTVSGAGTVDKGQSVTIQAIPSSGYVFKHWAPINVTTNPYTFTPIENVDYTAVFARELTLSLTANPVDGGTVSGAGKFAEGDIVTVTASPNKGYTFVRWTSGGNGVSNEADYSFTLSDNTSLEAEFAPIIPYTVTLTAEPAEGGKVSGEGSYESGTDVPIAASPAAGYRFVCWADADNGNADVSTVSNYTINGIAANVNYIAMFEPSPLPQYTVGLSTSPAEGGTVSGEGSYTEGDNATLSATANVGYLFEGWFESGVLQSTENPYVFPVTADITLEARFTTAPTYTVTLDADPAAAGVVTGEGSFAQGTPVTVVATANTGYRFMHWVDATDAVQSNEREYTFGIAADISLTAKFEPIPTYVVTVSANPANAGTVSGGGTYYEGTEVNIEATPQPGGYTFKEWLVNGISASTEPSYKLPPLTADVACEAIFEAPHYSITVHDDGNGTATGFDPASTYPAGSIMPLTASPNSGFLFKCWKDANGKIIGTDSTYKFRLTQNTELWLEFIDKASAPVGSEYNPIAIASSADLVDFRTAVNTGGTYKGIDMSNGAEGKYFRLKADVDLSTEPNWEPIGSSATPFQGSFNGGMHIVTGLTIDASTENAGLFGYIRNASVEKLALVGTNVKGSSNVGAVCGMAQSSTIAGCSSVGEVYASEFAAGGICGQAMGGSIITRCASTGMVTAKGSQAGGICGYSLLNTVVSNCFNASLVAAEGSYAGGICGFVALAGRVDSCLSVGTVGSEWYSGAIVGQVYASSSVYAAPSIGLCYYDNQVSAVRGMNGLEADGISGQPTANLIGLDAQIELDRAIWHTAANQYPMLEMVAVENHEHILAATTPIMLNPIETVEQVSQSIDLTPGASWISINGLVDLVAGKATPLASGSEVLMLEHGGLFVRVVPMEINKTDKVYITVLTENGSVSGLMAEYGFGETVRLTAMPKLGYRVEAWYEGGAEVETSNVYEFVATVSRSLTLRCSMAPCMVTVDVEGQGNVSGGNAYTYGDMVTLTATAEANNLFLGWEQGGRMLSINPTYRFTVTGDVSIKAIFVPQSYFIRASVADVAHGRTTGTGSYSHGQMVTLIATPYVGYSFSCWVVNDVEMSTEASYSFEATEALTAVAHFVQAQYDVVVLSADGGSNIKEGQVNDRQQYREQHGHGEQLTLTARPNTGYTFVAWVEGRDTVSRSASYTFAVLKPRTLRVCFRWVGTVSGIEEQQQEPLALGLHPNPATSYVTVEAEGMTLVQLYDLAGGLKLQSAAMPGQSSLQLSTASLAPGMYLVRVADRLGRHSTAKLVVR